MKKVFTIETQLHSNKGWGEGREMPIKMFTKTIGFCKKLSVCPRLPALLPNEARQFHLGEILGIRKFESEQIPEQLTCVLGSFLISWQLQHEN